MKGMSQKNQEKVAFLLFRVIPLATVALVCILVPLAVLFWPTDIGLGQFNSWRKGLPLLPDQTGEGRVGWITSAYGTDAGYKQNLLALAGSFRKFGGEGPLLVLNDGSIDGEFRVQLEHAGCRIVIVDPVPVPESTARTLDEPRHLPNFIRLRLWNLTEYSKLIYIDSDMLFVKDVAPIRHLPCNSGVPQRRGTINGGMMVLCPDQGIAESMLKHLARGGRYPVAEQSFISSFFWGHWHYASTCLNARASSDYRPWLRSFARSHLFFSPSRDVCSLDDVVLLHFNGAAKPWSANAARYYSPEILELYSGAVLKYLTAAS